MTNWLTEAVVAGSVPTASAVPTNPFADAATGLRRLGWMGTVPLPFRKKSPPETGWTGAKAGRVYPSGPDVQEWIDERPHPQNICLRLPEDVVGIDVDAYTKADGTVKLGDVSFARAVEEWGPLPATWMSTSRSDGQSGIRLFRVPTGLRWPGKVGENGIDVIHWGHRYVVCSPSLHPEGRPYRWVSPQGVPAEFPCAPRDLPEMPRAWVEGLTRNVPAADRVSTGATVTQYVATLRAGADSCDIVDHTLGELVDATTGGNRHDDVRDKVLFLVRLGAWGHRGVQAALDTGFSVWMRNLTGDRGATGARGEYARMVDGAVDLIGARPADKVCHCGGGLRADVTVLASPGKPEAPGEDVRASGAGDVDDENWHDDMDEDSTTIGQPQNDEEPEDRLDLRTGARGKDGRVRIHVGDKPKVMPWLRAEMGRGELSGLFVRGSSLVHTPRVGEKGYIPPREDGADDGPAQVRPVSLDGLISMIEVRYDVGTVREKEDEAGNRRKWWTSCLFPKDLATRCIGSALAREGVANLRTLNGTTHTPVMRKDGTILDQPGYDQATGMLYLPPAGAQQVSVPEFPTAEQVAAAREMILYPVGQFPFVTDDDLANWVGAALTPLLRPLVPPPYQFLIIEAPSPGSGKGFLLGVLNSIHGVAMRAGMPTKDEEMSKVIMTMLASTTAPIVAFDNVRGVVHSAALEGLLTSAMMADRTLGKNTEALSLPNDRLWCMTGNNAQIGGDLARRALRVTIDPGMESPEARVGFRCNPPRWAAEHRGEYIGALLTIARAWVVAGRPVREVERSDDYATWVQTVRGILEFAGFSGVFANRVAKAEQSIEDQEWGRFLHAIWDVLGDGDFTAREINGMLGENEYSQKIHPDVLPGDLTERYGAFGKETAFVKALGLWFRNRVGRWADGLVVQECGKGTSGPRKNVAVYRVKAAPNRVPEPRSAVGAVPRWAS